LVGELLLSTGGVLAALGALGLVAGGILALESGGGGDVVGPALIALGVLSLVAFYFITRKVLAAHRSAPARTGAEELVGGSGDARSTLAREGQVWIGGALGGARLADGSERIGVGDRVTVDAVDGLTLVVRPEAPPAGRAEEGAS